MSTITPNATPGQIKQINRFGSDAIEKVLEDLDLDHPGAQRVIEHGDEFTHAIREAAETALKELSTSNRFKNEEVISNYGYLSGYTGPKPIAEQCAILRRVLKVGFADEKVARREVPKHAEGWFAIPKWQTIAPTYAEALIKVLDALNLILNCKLYKSIDNHQINNEDLRQTAKTEALFHKLSEQQKDHDILVVAAQFGVRHRGRSARRTREVMQVNECGLGAFAVGIMLITHPERLAHYDDLWIDCAGDEINDLDAIADFYHTLRFNFDNERVEFGMSWSDSADKANGSPSAFVPQF